MSRKKITIKSYGTIIFKIFNGKLYVLLVKQKYTFAYSDFIKGKYSPGNCEKLLRRMTTDEIKKIKSTNKFRTLWDEFWIGNRNMNDHARKKFNIIKKKGNIKFQDRQYDNRLLWGFPKGRMDKNDKKNKYTCALRETWEETSVSGKDLTLLDIKPITEYKYIRRSKIIKKYKIEYYPMFLTNNNKYLNLKLKNKFQKHELSDIKWFQITKAYSLLELRRKNILNRIFLFIDSSLYNKNHERNNKKNINRIKKLSKN